MKSRIILLALLILSVVIYGCTTDVPYEPPQKVITSADNANGKNIVQIVPKEEPQRQAEPEPPKVTEFKIGETATDNQLRITVNSVDFKKVIDFESTFSTIPFEAKESNEFVVIDLTIENILDDKTQTPVLTVQSSVMDQDGYNYLYDTASIAVDKIYDNKDILPGMKKRGKVVYSVPEDATDLKFLFKFDLFRDKTAVFDIK
ncbi:DUF4352 domain-containing protein [Candidatus Woesearchaeota archaeon]|nr:DUF4352 domain-containing protein [Candidatus Woesearchaeota archaeon]